MDRRAWQATVHGVVESDTIELSWEQVGKILSSLYIQNNYMVAERLVRDKVTQLESDRI